MTAKIFLGIILAVLMAGCSSSPTPPIAADIEGPTVEKTQFTEPSPGAATVRVSDPRVAIVAADAVTLAEKRGEGLSVYRKIYLQPGFHCVAYSHSDKPITSASFPLPAGSLIFGCFDARSRRDYTITPGKFEGFIKIRKEFPKIIDTESREIVLGRGTDEIADDAPKARAVVSLIGPNDDPFAPYLPAVVTAIYQGGKMATQVKGGLFGKQREFEIAAGNRNVVVVGVGSNLAAMYSVDLDLETGQIVRLAIGQKGLYVIDESNNQVLRRPS